MWSLRRRVPLQKEEGVTLTNPKVDKVLHLIDVKAEKLAEAALNERHSSLSHISKERKELLINVAKEHIVDLLIRQLNRF